MRPTLDYVPRLDERNRAHRVTAAPDLMHTARYWTPGTVITDQGREGACVGHGVTNEWLASPVRGRFPGLSWIGTEIAANRLALDIYNRAKAIDEWEGVDYDGTSVRAGMLVGRERGWWSGFSWAFTMTELRTALEAGPVVLGVEWRDDAYEAPDGILHATGRAVGGHCILLTGYTPRHRTIGGPAWRLRNSWSKSWGLAGNAYIPHADLDRILFRAGGEAAVPVGRKL
jgi:hypothetical protein